MKIYVLIVLALLTVYVNISTGSYISSIGKYSSGGSEGAWKLKTQWKFQWVKEWHAKKVYIPVWKKVWTPVEIKEWIPLPNIPHK